MSKEQLDIFYIPVLEIVTVSPQLEKDGIVYAQLIKAKSKLGKEYVFRERKRMNIEQFIGKAVECVLEVVQADFFYPTEEETKKLPDTVETGTYVWKESPSKFFPSLVEMIEGHGDDDNYEYDDKEYEKLSEECIENWGISGFGISFEEDKPMVKTNNGVFIFNEFQNEYEVDKWELGQKIYFQPREMILQGIKPYEGKWETKHKDKAKEEEPLMHYEKLIVGKPRIIDPW